MKRILCLFAAVIAALTFLPACTEDAPEESTAATSSVSITDISREIPADTTLPADVSADELFETLSSDGWVALYCYDLLSGGEIWNDFLSKTSKGEAASVLMVNYYPPTPPYEDEPSIFLIQVDFNGSTYSYSLESYPSNGSPSVTEYKYIVKYELAEEDVYILVNKNDYTYEEIERSVNTSISSYMIDFSRLVTVPK